MHEPNLVVWHPFAWHCIPIYNSRLFSMASRYRARRDKQPMRQESRRSKDDYIRTSGKPQIKVILSMSTQNLSVMYRTKNTRTKKTPHFYCSFVSLSSLDFGWHDTKTLYGRQYPFPNGQLGLVPLWTMTLVSLCYG